MERGSFFCGQALIRTHRIPATIGAPQGSNRCHHCNAAIANALRHSKGIARKVAAASRVLAAKRSKIP
jgi:hypothetical protein